MQKLDNVCETRLRLVRHVGCVFRILQGYVRMTSRTREDTSVYPLIMSVEREEDDLECKELSHVEAMKRVHELELLLLSDPFLQDLPRDVSLDEIQSQLALEQGRAISLQLRRFDNEIIRKWWSGLVSSTKCMVYTHVDTKLHVFVCHVPRTCIYMYYNNV